MSSAEGDYLHVVTADDVSDKRRKTGRFLTWGAAAVLAAVILAQILNHNEVADLGFENWRPTLYAYLFWATCLCFSQVLLYGERGKRTLFVLPAVLFVVSMVVFPLIFALGIAFSSWKCSPWKSLGVSDSTSRGWVFPGTSW